MPPHEYWEAVGRAGHAPNEEEAVQPIPQSHLDLLELQVATLATIRPGGGPQMTEVWFLREGDTVALSLNATRKKTRNLMRDPRCSLLILDLANPYRYLELRGEVEITDDPEYLFASRVGAKYSADLRQHDQPGDKRVIVTLHIQHVNAVDMSS